MAKISILVPICNVEKYLNRCLDSILNQTFADIEVLCMDDGSTDSSGDIIDAYASKDARVKVIHKPNSGYGHTMNMAIEMSTGDYIGIVESDDYIRDDMFQKMYDVVTTHDLDFVKTDYYQLWERADGSEYVFHKKLTNNDVLYHKVMNPNELTDMYFAEKFTWNALYKREFLQEHNIRYNETPGASYQDNGFWFQTFYHAKRIMFLDEAFYYYKQDNPNSSINSTKKVFAMKHEYDFIRQFLLSQKEENKFYYNICFHFRMDGYLYTLSMLDEELRIELAEVLKNECEEFDALGESIYEWLPEAKRTIVEKICVSPMGYLDEQQADRDMMLERLVHKRHVIIYGVGVYGKRVYHKLKNYRLKNVKLELAVTSLKDVAPYYIYNTIKEISDYEKEKENCLVIVCAKKGSKAFEDMMYNLQNIGFANIKVYDEIMPPLYSFDVFDTLVTRKVATPKGIFAIIQNELQENEAYAGIDSYIRENFYYLRVHAEELARNTYCHSGVQDVTLSEIYEALGITCGLSSEEQKQLVDLEVTTECANIVPIKQNIDRVMELVGKHMPVVLISDMYLETEYVRKILCTADERLRDVPLYVSSDIKCCKWNGRLFQHVRSELKPEWGWVHIGDNKNSDVEIPKNQGIQVQPFRFEQLLECEKEVLKDKESNVTMQLLIGAARNTRLVFNLKDEAAIGSSIGAGILFPYAYWILKQSQKRGVKRLYFIARDGYMPKLIIDSMIKELGLDIQTYYIYGSRLTWRIPSLSEEDWDLMNILRWSDAARITTMRKFAEFLQVETEELYPYLPNYYHDAEVKLTIVEVHYLIIYLEGNAEFKHFLLDKHAAKRAIAVEYLKQEIDVSDDAFSFVDLSGSGYTQGCLANMMKDFYAGRIHTFFFKMDFLHIADQCDFSIFLPSKMDKELIVEMICRAPHGQTMDYRIDDSSKQIVPILSEGEGQAICEHGYNEYLNGIELVSKAYLELVKQNLVTGNTLELLLEYFKYLTQIPDLQLLDFYGEMPNSLTGREKKVKVFAPKLTKEQIRKIFFLGQKEAYDGSCLDFSVMRCSEEKKTLIKYYKEYRNTEAAKELIEKENRDYRDIWDVLQQFPYGMLSQKTILYGAGKFGQQLMERVVEKNLQDNVIWVDKRFTELENLQERFDVPVTGLESLENNQDCLIILAVKNRNMAEQITKELEEMGVSSERIWWIDCHLPYQRAAHKQR